MWLEANAIPGNGSVCMLLVGNDHNLHDNDDNKVVKTDTGKVNFIAIFFVDRWAIFTLKMSRIYYETFDGVICLT